MSFSHNNSISSTGLSLGNGIIDIRFFLPSMGLNFGPISRSIHVPLPAFPLSEVITTRTELRRTSRLLSSNSTTGLVFPSSSRFGTNHEISPPQPNHNHKQFLNTNLLRPTNPRSENRTDVRSDIERETNQTTSLRSDGRSHSLRGYAPGTYRCPKCLATFSSPQMFVTHVRSIHYSQEGEEERRKRMAAMCRRRNLRLRRSSQGLTVVPVSSKGVTKGHAARWKKETAVEVGDVHRVRNGVGAAAMRGPLASVTKEEPV